MRKLFLSLSILALLTLGLSMNEPLNDKPDIEQVTLNADAELMAEATTYTCTGGCTNESTGQVISCRWESGVQIWELTTRPKGIFGITIVDELG